jgi:hypothetical protein
MSFEVKTEEGISIPVRDCFSCPSCKNNVIIDKRTKKDKRDKNVLASVCMVNMRNIIEYEGDESRWELFMKFWKIHGKEKVFPSWCPRLTEKSRGAPPKAKEKDFIPVF